jgi:hypothetical protein
MYLIPVSTLCPEVQFCIRVPSLAPSFIFFVYIKVYNMFWYTYTLWNDYQSQAN